MSLHYFNSILEVLENNTRNGIISSSSVCFSTSPLGSKAPWCLSKTLRVFICLVHQMNPNRVSSNRKYVGVVHSGFGKIANVIDALFKMCL